MSSVMRWRSDVMRNSFANGLLQAATPCFRTGDLKTGKTADEPQRPWLRFGMSCYRLPRSGLSEVPDQRAREVAGPAQRGSVAGHVRARGVHVAALARAAGLSQQKAALRSAVPRQRRDVARSRGESQTLGRGTRIPERAAHVGTNTPASSARALRDSRGRSCAGSPALDSGASGLLLARARAAQS